MRIVYIDESGFSLNWKSDLGNQPIYCLAAVCLPAESVCTAHDTIRKEIAAKVQLTSPLGRGSEIKANDIVKGTGYWSKRDALRNFVRNEFLEAPRRFDGTAFLVVVDNVAMAEKYINPADPVLWAFQLLFERLQKYLKRVDDFAICLHDMSKRMEELNSFSANLASEGSIDLKILFSTELKTERILDLAFGESKNSIGLQIADYYATCSRAYHKGGKRKPCGWWDEIWKNLDASKGGTVDGYGYKFVPQPVTVKP